MNFLKQYSLIIGLSILIVVLALLFSSSDLIFSSSVTFIDSDLLDTSGTEVNVKTKMDLGNEEYMASFPLQMGGWVGYEMDTAEWEEKLGADVSILRGYTAPGWYKPVNFLILQSDSEYGFHPPRLCYPAHGYTIQEDGHEQVMIMHPDWTKENSNISIPMEKLVLVKESDGSVTERLIVLTFYFRGNQFTTDTITMIRVEADAPNEGSYEAVLNVEKDLIIEAIPLMFDPDEQDEWNPIVAELASWGIGGYFVIIALMSIPLGIIIYPKIRYKQEPNLRKSEAE